MATNKNFSNRMSRASHRSATQPQQEGAITPSIPAPKKKAGRPKTKTGSYKTINVAVPEEILEDLKIATCKYHNNMTEYINHLIQADLEANLDKYKQLQTILNS